ncbi:hypothetical protein [uncultured Lacinutrix sp.]|uniref:hypothetical protein n=1 Tax=uncultured Lacinutrix sp. TaxID=574032 RepID=UPI00260C1A94|nr:hypothetical protein [uncultured Lacinutrix sp.]
MSEQEKLSKTAHSIKVISMSIDKVNSKMFFLQNAPTKPMVSASCLKDEELYMYQVDVAVYLPQEINNLHLKKWGNNNYISQYQKAGENKNKINGSYRQITIQFDGNISNILTQDIVMFDLYTIQICYTSTQKEDPKNIFVDYVFDDPETTRGTVTTVRDVDATSTSG